MPLRKYDLQVLSSSKTSVGLTTNSFTLHSSIAPIVREQLLAIYGQNRECVKEDICN